MSALIPDVAFDAKATRCHVRLVSHAHADHLPSRPDPVLVASPATIRFIQILRPKLQFGTVIPIRPGETTLVPMPSLAAPLSVTAFDAMHCAGSLMFLVETNGTKLLYTGDTRIEASSLETLMQQLNSARGVDVLAADATFFHPRWRFPPRSQAIAEVLQLIREHAPEQQQRVYIEADMLGCEVLMEAVARAFHTQVHVVDRTRHALFASMDSLKSHLTQEASATRFHFCQFQSLTFHVQQPQQRRRTDLYIRPSAQWFGQQQQGTGEVSGNHGPVLSDGVWHVLFSMHCSHAELAAFVRSIRPRAVLPLVPATTPPSGVETSLCELLEDHRPNGGGSSFTSSLSSAPLLGAGLLPDAKVLGSRSTTEGSKRMRLQLRLDDDDVDDLDAFISDTPLAKRNRANDSPDNSRRLL